MGENRICKLPCSQYKPDGPTDLGVGGWCREHHHPCLLVECQRRDIIKAVLAGKLSKADIDAIGYSIEHPNDRLISLEKEWRVIWDGRTYSIEKDNPCPTCDGSGETKHFATCSISGKPAKTVCKTCGGSGMMSSEWDSEVPVPCPDCEGKHFIPGKGRGM